MTPTDNPTLCRAWLGYAIDESRADIVARICAWCPDKVTAETEATRLRLTVTHGICPRCAGIQLDLLKTLT